MTQPRKEQIKSVDVHHASFPTVLAAGAATQTIAPASINPALVTQTPNGAAVPTPATVLGTTTELFPIIAGDSIFVTHDGSGPFTVTFTTFDTTAAKIAARINAATANTATNENGKVRVSTHGTGSAAVLVLADNVPGTLAKLGLAAGTYLGSDLQRGVITQTPGLLGGYVAIRGTDGRKVMADNLSNRLIFTNGPTRRLPDLPAGMPVHGRIKFDGSNYNLNYFVKIPARPSVITGDSRFDLLDNTDSLNVIIDTVTNITVTFPSPVYTPAGVADRINGTYAASVTGGGGGNVVVTGTNCGPYTLNGTINIAVDGGAAVPVALSTTNASVASVAATIQAAVAGITCVSASGQYGNSIQLRSNNNVGRTSSLNITPVGAAGQAVLDKLGITAGLYRGIFIAELYGTQSVRISSPQRGSIASVQIAGSGQTLGRMGLTAATTAGSDAEADEPVNFPTPNFTSGGNVNVNLLIPEALEFGEVPSDTDRSMIETADTVAGFNFGPQLAEYTETAPLQRYRGFRDVGKPVIIGPDGLVDPSVLRAATDPIFSTFSKMLEGDAHTANVTGLISAAWVGPGGLGNTILPVQDMFIDVDPSNGEFGFRSVSVRFERDVAPAIGFRFGNQVGAGSPNVVYTIELPQASSALHNSAGPLWFTDPNVITALIAEVGPQVLPLTSSTSGHGDTFLRLIEQIATPTRYSGGTIVRSLNARWTITVGDGVKSFGDFSGNNAIQQAISYFNANASALTSCRILVKEGDYQTGITPGAIHIPSPGATSRRFTIEGISRLGPYAGTVNAPFSDGATITMVDTGFAAVEVNSGAVLNLKNLRFKKDSGASGLMSYDSTNFAEIEDCHFINFGIFFTSPFSYRIARTRFDNGTITDRPTLLLAFQGGSGLLGPYVHDDVDIIGGQDLPIMRVQAIAVPAPSNQIDIIWNRCNLTCGAATTNAGNLTGNPGVLDLAPGGLVNGVKIRRIRFKDCNVRSVHAGGGSSILAHVTTKANADTVYVVGVPSQGRINITRFEIDGGTWIAPRVNTTFNPFTVIGVGNDDLTSTGLGSVESGGLFVQNCVLGFSIETGSSTGITQGSATNDIAQEFLNSSAPPTAQWGAFAFGARYIECNGIQYAGGSAVSTLGDMVFFWHRANLRKFLFTRYASGGPGTFPSQRVRFRPYSANSEFLTVQDWKFLGEGSPLVNSIIASYLFPEPNSVTRVQNTNGAMTFDDIVIRGFGVMGGNGIFLDGDQVPGSYYSGSPNHYKNVTIRRCRFDQPTQAGIQYKSSTDGNFIANLKILDNIISSSSNVGIWINTSQTTATPWDNLVCSNNTVRDCAGIGIQIIADVWNTSVMAMINISNNICQNNNGGANALQISTGFGGGNAVVNQDPRGVVMGNVCDVGGKIECHQSNGGGAKIPLSAGTPVFTSIRGMETSYDATVTAATTNTRNFTNGQALLFNVAFLSNT